MAQVDLVVRGGIVVDGSGNPGFRADVAIDHGRIVGVGSLDLKGRQEIDAEGHVVTPGFVDGHTHMDAQVFWDQMGTCSCWHGVTTAVMGNCGFTLAPVEPTEEGRALAVRNLERAEDISGEAMAAGLDWGWSTFPEYLDAVERVPKGINYAANIGHSALRTWVMGQRAFTERASAEDMSAMEAELRAALRAGAVGFSTSQSPTHQTSDDRPVASRLADWAEVSRLVEVMGEEGRGVFQFAPPPDSQIGVMGALDPELRRDFDGRYQKLAVSTGVTIANSFPALTSGAAAGLELVDQINDSGGRMFGMTSSRPLYNIVSFRTRLPFDRIPEWAEVRQEPLERQKVLLKDESVRRRLVQAAHRGTYTEGGGVDALRKPDFDLVSILVHADRPNPTIAGEATRRGVDPVELMIDLALETDFGQFFEQGFFVPNQADMVRFMRHPRTVTTLSDSGAHVTQILDASIHTYLLSYWVRQMEAFPLEEAVNMITWRSASAWGFSDRGLVREGMAADINVLDPDEVGPESPRLVHDLPGGGPRLVQRARGIRATIVNGRVLMVDGQETGERPGRMLRGPFQPSL